MTQDSEISTGHQVDQLVASLNIDVATGSHVTSVAERICALGRHAVESLAQGILHPGPAHREKVAALLGCLRGQPASWAQQALERLLATRPMTPMERIWLGSTVESLAEEAPASVRGVRPAGVADPGRERDMIPSAPEESELLYWRDEFAGLGDPEQEAALASIIQAGDPELLPLLEMAMTLHKTSLDALIAEGLAHLPVAGALPLLRQLLRRSDPAVRRSARKSLLAIEHHGVSTRDVFIAESRPDEPVVTSLATPLDGVGQMAVLLARERGKAHLQYAIVILDTLDAGILRAWAEPRVSLADFRERIRYYSEQSGLAFDPVDASVAQALVAVAEDFAGRRGRPLPADYFTCRSIIGRPAGSARLPVRFGPECTLCGRAITPHDPADGGILAGDVAICSSCVKQPFHCVACGRRIHHVFDEFLVRRGSGDTKVEFLCVACRRKQEQA